MPEPSTPKLTTSSYAILGLLALRPWTTYELAKQMAVSLRNFWPRAESKLYEEPKKLVALGLADVRAEFVGRRPRSVYEITGAGRDALRAWLGEPGAMAVLEFESLVKVFFAEQGTKAQLVATLERILDEQRRRAAIEAEWARAYADGRAAFPERLGVLSLVGPLQVAVNRTIRQWAEESLATVAGWPEDLRRAVPAPGVFEASGGGGARRRPGVDDRGDGHEPVLAAGEDPEGHAPG